MLMAPVMRDHPAWRQHGHGWSRALRGPDGSVELALTDAAGLAVSTGPAACPPVVYRLAGPLAGAPELDRELAGLGEAVIRWRTPSLWEALLTAIIRQVIRAPHARLLYHRLCVQAGEAVEVAGHVHHLPPGAGEVAGMPGEDLVSLGLKFKIPVLAAASDAYLKHREVWEALPPADLVAALQEVRRIGPWTARAAVADYTGDFSFYPHGDLAVRTWASAAAPTIDWPGSEAAFAQWWRDLAGTRLSELTVFVLTWGDRHGKTTPVP